MIKVYEWSQVPNFGDRLSVPLLRHFARVEVEATAHPSEADVLCVGSVLGHVGDYWTGTILGSGDLFRSTGVPRDARVLGVRGPHTRARLTDEQRSGCIAVGDPGLLADALVGTPPERVHRLGILPHWSDTELKRRPEFRQYDPLYIEPRTTDPFQVIRKIGSCEKLVTSSLHGLVIADAFGIPVRFETCERMLREGGTFKHEEHCASIKASFQPGRTREVQRFNVDDVRDQLIDMFETWGEEVRGES